MCEFIKYTEGKSKKIIIELWIEKQKDSYFPWNQHSLHQAEPTGGIQIREESKGNGIKSGAHEHPTKVSWVNPVEAASQSSRLRLW